VDTTDFGQIFLSKSCLGVEIITAKCSAISISLLVEGEDEEIFPEKPIPEMFQTVVDGGKLVTNVAGHSVSERNRGGVAAAMGVQEHLVSNLCSSQKAKLTMSVSYSLGCRRRILVFHVLVGTRGSGAHSREEGLLSTQRTGGRQVWSTASG